MSLLKELSQDVALYHGLRFPGRPATLFSRARLLLLSRGLFVLAAHRIAYRCRRKNPGGRVGWLLNRAQLVLARPGIYFSMVLAKCEILALTRMEGGVYISDRGYVILGASSIGSGTVIHDHVTIGMNMRDREIPEIGRNVWIGPRCVLYGGIKVGAGATLLPGTVLTRSLPPGAVVQGNPARVLELNFDNAPLRSSPVPEIVFSQIGSSLSSTDLV